MGCGSSHVAHVHDRRAYHGVAMPLIVSPVTPVGGDLAASSTLRTCGGGWEGTHGADKKSNSDFYFGVNEALQRQMRRQRIAEWRKTTLGIVRETPRGPPQKPRYDHLTKIGGCQLGMVDELCAYTRLGEPTLSDGATRSADHSQPSSLSTSGCTTFVNYASVRLDSSSTASLQRSGGAAQLNASTGTQGSRGHPPSFLANASIAHSTAAPHGGKQHTLQRYRVEPCNNGHAHRVRLVLLVPQGDIILSCSTVDRHMTAYHTRLHTEVGRLVGHDDVLLGAAVSPDGRLVATASRDGTAILWELPSCKQRRSLPHRGAVHACRFSSTRAEVATVCEDGHCRVWTWTDADVVNTLVSAATGFDGALTSVAYTMEDRQVLAGGVANSVFVWDRQRFAEPAAVFRPHRSAILALDASRTVPDLVMSADERSIYVWNCQTLEVMHCLSVESWCVPRRAVSTKRKSRNAAAASTAHASYWTTVRLVDTQYGIFIVAAASDKCMHLFEVESAPEKHVSVSEALTFPFSSSVSCVDGNPSNLIALGDTCGNRHILTLM